MSEKYYGGKTAEVLRRRYPPGTRIELILMEDDPRPVSAGTRGTVKGVDDMGHILMRWDTGSSLSLIPGSDVFRTLTAEEIMEEKTGESMENAGGDMCLKE